MLLALLVFTLNTQPPSGHATWGVDPSWQQALQYCHAEGLQAGVDFALSHGPLGFTRSPYFHPATYWANLAWTLLYGAVLTGAVLGLCSTLTLPWRFPLIAVALLQAPASGDLRLLLVAILPTLWALRSTRGGAWPSLAVCAWLGVLALVKHTLLFLSLPALALLVYKTWRTQKPFALALPLTWLLSHVLAWVALGQSLGAYPAYLGWVKEFAGFYGPGAGRAGPTWELVLGLACLASLGAYALICLRELPEPDERPALAFLIVLAPLSFKMGFVRHDVLHTFQFFGLWLALSPFLLPAERSARRALSAKLTLGLVLLGALTQLSFMRRVHPVARGNTALQLLSGPETLRARELVRMRALKEETPLQRIAEIVGQDPVDVFTFSCGAAILYELNWRPRFTLQSYVAYSPRLAEKNAASLSGDSPPQHVVMAWLCLDQRLATTEDGPALLELLARYELVYRHPSGLCLLTRRAVPRAAPEQLLGSFEPALGEWVELGSLGAGAKSMRVELDLSLAGRLYALALRGPGVFLEVRIKGGDVGRFRLPLPLARSRFLIDPLVRSGKDFQGLFAGELPLGEVEAVRLVPNEVGAWAHADRAKLEVYAAPAVAPAR
ncbi:MAG TPA: hypothetical protein DEA08_26810 [Planctomycetes bacterium]|nr:hypothetical protein [Planctomycetota bacterium]